jgi:hypothetical protein
MYLFNKPGFCWDGENKDGKFKACVEEILPKLTLSPNLIFDSVYVYKRDYYGATAADSIQMRIYISAHYAIILKKETLLKNNKLISSERVVSISEK